ncbi:hypothetical protein C8J57DRAFT_1224402 [Mycena rebaudengoi]|nr:hypothetical protein C8J57DRAFT_1224402 [Mycena rebaudengoi]
MSDPLPGYGSWPSLASTHLTGIIAHGKPGKPTSNSTFRTTAPTVSWCPLAKRAPLRRPRIAKLSSENLQPNFSRYPDVDCLASIPQESIIPQWVQSGHMDRFSGKIEFEPRHILDMTHLAKDDDDHIVCCIAFNTDATSPEALSGPDGEEFIEAARKVMKIDQEEEGSFMWYRILPRLVWIAREDIGSR